MSEALAHDDGPYEALLQFLYLAPFGLIQANEDGLIEMCNPMSAKLLMPLVEKGRLDNIYAALSRCLPELPRLIDEHGSSNGVICDGLRFEVPAPLRDVEESTYDLQLTRIQPGQLLYALSDVTHEVERERRALDRRLHDAARVDALTAMPNRIAIGELIAQASKVFGGRHRAVLLIGGAPFQQMTDSFGHALVDQLLCAIAGRIDSVLRPAECVACAGGVDQIAARVGTDQFVVLLQELDEAEDAVLVAHRVLDVLARPYALGAAQLDCTLSIGIVNLTDAESEADTVLRHAAIALGEATRTGRSCTMLFDASMRDRAVERGHIQVDLLRAIANREFFVVYQPVVHMAGSMGTAGVEALVRWRHPVRGVIPPIEFIGVAEETGLIRALGRIVLTTACADFAKWSGTFGVHAPQLLAINLSRAQLDDAYLVQTVSDAVLSQGLAMNRIQLEVTESLAAQDVAVQTQLHALKRLGLTLALDDFGTGYSSLSSLHLLPVDTVKIDRTFVSMLGSSVHHRVLVEATIKVAKSLNMTTVAEGIETAEQSRMIRDLGCDKAQGYHFSRPLTAPEMETWLGARL